MKVAVTILVFCVAALLALGMVMLYSSSSPQFGARYLMLQLLWCVLGAAACVVATLTDYRQLKRVWWVLLVVALVMLALVLNKHIGVVRGHARRWFSFGGMSFQPSEFAKLAVIIALAWYGDRFQRQMPTWKRGILIPGLLIGLAVGLIVKEPDVGNGLVLATVSGILLLIAGIRLRYFLPPVMAGALALGLFIYQNPMRSERIYSWLHLEETKLGKGMQAYEAMVALGSGGLTGKGLGDGRQKLGWVPEHHTDFIFSIIGEELGLIATLLVVLAFVAILLCGICIAAQAGDTFGLLLGAGITFLISLQAFINIGVVTSALPNKGLPLPFISYGGSSLLITLTSVGLLLSIARNGRPAEAVADRSPHSDEFQDPNPFKSRNTKSDSRNSDEIRSPKSERSRLPPAVGSEISGLELGLRIRLHRL
jgi:cell division protein FtsW